MYQRQSAEHSNVIEQSQSAISQQEKQTEELFVTRREQQQVCSCPCACSAASIKLASVSISHGCCRVDAVNFVSNHHSSFDCAVKHACIL